MADDTKITTPSGPLVKGWNQIISYLVHRICDLHENYDETDNEVFIIIGLEKLRDALTKADDNDRLKWIDDHEKAIKKKTSVLLDLPGVSNVTAVDKEILVAVEYKIPKLYKTVITDSTEEFNPYLCREAKDKAEYIERKVISYMAHRIRGDWSNWRNRMKHLIDFCTYRLVGNVGELNDYVYGVSDNEFDGRILRGWSDYEVEHLGIDGERPTDAELTFIEYSLGRIFDEN
jgi:hypothetical protein